jgi:hypothetical protein
MGCDNRTCMRNPSSFERQKAPEIVDTSVMPSLTYNKRYMVSLMQATAALIQGWGLHRFCRDCLQCLFSPALMTLNGRNLSLQNLVIH